VGDDINMTTRSNSINAVDFIIITKILLELCVDQALEHYVQHLRDELRSRYKDSNPVQDNQIADGQLFSNYRLPLP